MIYVRLMGGLGNQMFQYAFSRTLADILEEDLAFDTRSLTGKLGHDVFSLRDFNVRGRIATANEMRRFSNFSTRVFNINQRLYHFLFPGNISEVNYTANLAGRIKGRNVLVNGYWQDERYFVSNRKQILRDLQINHDLFVSNELTDEISRPNSVSIHIRRGDYVSNKETNKYHGLCSTDFYSRAMERVLLLYPNSNFVVFSNDYDWAKANVDSAKFDVFFAEPNSGIADMYNMSLCKHHIISNSTFSWWSAWLNKNPDKMVIAPYPWFADFDKEYLISIPGTWFRIAK